MKVTISDAARLAGVSRQHFYVKYLNKGVLSVDRTKPDKPVIDISELFRVFPDMKLPDNLVSTDRQELTQELASQVTALDKELQSTREQLAASQARENWLKQTVDKLTDTIKLLEHRPAAEPIPKRGFFARLFRGGQ